MIDALGHTLKAKDIVGRLGDRTIMIARVVRFTPKKVGIVFPALTYEYATATSPATSRMAITESLVHSQYLVRLEVTPEIQEYIDQHQL